MPRISVIVPARNSAATIGRTLSAVAAQRVAEAYEVVVVDDASSDDTGAIAQAAGARVVRHELPQGSARSRNAGAAAASGEILAFTDADCEPQPGWLGAGLAVLRGADLVQGRVIPEPGVHAGPFAKTLEVTGESGLFESANLFVTREAFVHAGRVRRVSPAGLRTGRGCVRRSPRGTSAKMRCWGGAWVATAGSPPSRRRRSSITPYIGGDLGDFFANAGACATSRRSSARFRSCEITSRRVSSSAAAALYLTPPWREPSSP